MSNASDLGSIRAVRGTVWHGAVEYERDGHGGFHWGREGLTWCGVVLTDGCDYDSHKITCKNCLRWRTGK